MNQLSDLLNIVKFLRTSNRLLSKDVIVNFRSQEDPASFIHSYAQFLLDLSKELRCLVVDCDEILDGLSDLKFEEGRVLRLIKPD